MKISWILVHSTLHECLMVFTRGAKTLKSLAPGKSIRLGLFKYACLLDRVFLSRHSSTYFFLILYGSTLQSPFIDEMEAAVKQWIMAVQRNTAEMQGAIGGGVFTRRRQHQMSRIGRGEIVED
jgi:hypothetical protein